MAVLLEYMAVLLVPRELQKSVSLPTIGAIEQLCGSSELNLGPLKTQPIFFLF